MYIMYIKPWPSSVE